MTVWIIVYWIKYYEFLRHYRMFCWLFLDCLSTYVRCCMSSHTHAMVRKSSGILTLSHIALVLFLGGMCFIFCGRHDPNAIMWAGLVSAWMSYEIWRFRILGHDAWKYHKLRRFFWKRKYLIEISPNVTRPCNSTRNSSNFKEERDSTAAERWITWFYSVREDTSCRRCPLQIKTHYRCNGKIKYELTFLMPT